ncbi:MAG: type VI secretion system tip protein VgrG [Candidatus Hydrogenedentes bacterium]|nr:type VI secretion system tip protein VgrG [Candidatus Hydrogenedentota bacterium]
MPRTQDTRWASIATPLGKDKLLFRRMAGVEELGRIFQYEVELCSEDPNITFDQIIGQNVTVRMNYSDSGARYINGVINRFARTQEVEDLTYYQATIVPTLWFLTRTRDCRIFQNKDAVAIIKEILGEQGISDVEYKLGSVTYPKREFCVMYRESYFDFISRLMEQEGIYYYFKHVDGVHTLVLINASSLHEAIPGYETMKFVLKDKGSIEQNSIFYWIEMGQFESGRFVYADFNPKTPKSVLKAQSEIARANAKANLERFDYPGQFTVAADGTNYAKNRIEEFQADYQTFRGECVIRGTACGALYAMTDYPLASQNTDYIITSTTINVVGEDYTSTPIEGQKLDPFKCSFTAIRKTAQFRSQSLTPKPFVHGPQTAIVVGPSGEEIYTDEYGRIKVQFHWDRYGKADANSSCFIRLAQSWAGKNWGAVVLPRIGQEVVVEFLEGDPDRPIVVGALYNEENKPPYELPTNMTMSVMKSSSSKGGAGFNEIRFEDKKDSEQIFVHGQKNFDKRILNDSFAWIGNDHHLQVINDRKEKVDNDKHETVGRDHIETVTRDHNLTIKGKEAIKVTGTHSHTVEGDVIQVYKANQSTEVTADYYLKGDNIVIEAATNITVKVGDSYIAIESSGITIGTTGKIELKADGDITIESGGNTEVTATGDAAIEATGKGSFKGTGGLALESPATSELKGASTTVSGDGSLTLKGGAVAIN